MFKKREKKEKKKREKREKEERKKREEEEKEKTCVSKKMMYGDRRRYIDLEVVGI